MIASARQEDLKKRLQPVQGSGLASVCKAASDPLRLDVLRVLRYDSFGVQELAAIFSMPQPGMSHHLKVLAKSGLLVSRRQGNSIFYRRALVKDDAHLGDFLLSLYGAIDAEPLENEISRKIRRVYEERSEQSRLFFERNADKFAEAQGMLCELSQYLGNIKELLDLIALPENSSVLEVGPGQGDLLEELARRYQHLVALDNSEEMLALTRTKVAPSHQIRFIKSSLEAFEHQGEAYDIVVLNMVLHHISSPEQALRKLRHLVHQGRYLLIADLCSHNQAWTRDSCGDVWLGFDPKDLQGWAESAGFREEQSLYLGLKNGFQIQLKLFHAI